MVEINFRFLSFWYQHKYIWSERGKHNNSVRPVISTLRSITPKIASRKYRIWCLTKFNKVLRNKMNCSPLIFWIAFNEKYWGKTITYCFTGKVSTEYPLFGSAQQQQPRNGQSEKLQRTWKVYISDIP